MVGGIVLVEEIDHDNIVALAIAVASPDPLFDALRIPGQVVIHHHGAELKVDTLGGSLGRDHDRGFLAEIVNERSAHIRCAGSGDSVGAFVARGPRRVDFLGLRVRVGPVEKHKLSVIAIRSEKPDEIFLRAAGFSEDDRLLGTAEF